MNPLTSVAAAKGREQRWLEALVAETSALQATQRYRDWLRATAWHWRYSPLNCLLIHLQRPDATRVAGRRAWEARGREVKPGAEPIAVLAPSGRGRFIGVGVFELQDTTGPRLAIDGWELRGGCRHVRRVEAAAALLGVTLHHLATRHGPFGMTGPRKNVFLRDALSPAERTATLVHEYAHALLGHADGDSLGTDRNEAEAEGVAWIVLKALGARSKAPEYLAARGVQPRDLRRSLVRIAQAARNILTAIDGKTPRRPVPPLSPNPSLEPLRRMLAQAARR